MAPAIPPPVRMRGRQGNEKADQTQNNGVESGNHRISYENVSVGRRIGNVGYNLLINEMNLDICSLQVIIVEHK